MEEDEGLKKLMWLKTMMIVIMTWMVEGSRRVRLRLSL